MFRVLVVAAGIMVVLCGAVFLRHQSLRSSRVGAPVGEEVSPQVRLRRDLGRDVGAIDTSAFDEQWPLSSSPPPDDRAPEVLGAARPLDQADENLIHPDM